MVLQVKHPCCCECLVDVPVCAHRLPEGRTACYVLLWDPGSRVVTYTWCDGFKVRVVFQHDGDLLVHTYGL